MKAKSKSKQAKSIQSPAAFTFCGFPCNPVQVEPPSWESIAKEVTAERDSLMEKYSQLTLEHDALKLRHESAKGAIRALSTSIHLVSNLK